MAVSTGSTGRVWSMDTDYSEFVITKSDTMNFPVITIFYVSDCSFINGDYFGYTKQNRGSEGFAITRVYCILLHKNTLSLIETNETTHRPNKSTLQPRLSGLLGTTQMSLVNLQSG